MRPVNADELLNKMGNILLGLYEHYYENYTNDDIIRELVVDAIKEAPTIDPVKHGSIDHIKSLYFSDGGYVINERSVCSDCGHSVDDFGQKFCSECGAKLNGEHHFFRKKTMFVEGENVLVPISHTEYKRAEEWKYEIDRC